ncbi:MAG: 4Fe-4S dicluster domain-containing protein [Thermodesulfobacteriota bacterium]
MSKRSFFGFMPPQLRYDTISDAQSEPATVSPKKKVTLFIDAPLEKAAESRLHVGDGVKRGQKLQLAADAAAYAISPVAGNVVGIAPFVGVMERQMTAVTIEVSADEADTAFQSQAKTPTMENAASFLSKLPGSPDFSGLMQPGASVKTIVVLGADNDLQTLTNQYVIQSDIASVKTGIDILRKISGVQNIILVVPSHLVQAANAAGAGVKTVSGAFPAAHPELIAMDLLADELGGHPSRENAAAFFSAEAVAAIGRAYESGQIPVHKLLTFVKKDGARHLISAPVGTHAGDVIEAMGDTVTSGDRLVFGGPMTGQAIYTLDHPVQPDTDAILVQDQDRIIEGKDVACTNCGECVRVCPTNVPVNELIRYLDAGQYEQAAEAAELYACIECGYCTYVCEARIPIFQFIRLAKHALERRKAAEEENA